MPVRLDNGHRQEIEDGKVIQKYARGTEINTPTRHVAFWATLPELTMLTVSANKEEGWMLPVSFVFSPTDDDESFILGEAAKKRIGPDRAVRASDELICSDGETV